MNAIHQTNGLLPRAPKPVTGFSWLITNACRERATEITMNKYFSRFFILTLLCAFAFNLGACNTMHGVGKDIQKAGDEIQEEADEHK
jgi:predicted small secreted protein